jgi:hypothetical protein
MTSFSDIPEPKDPYRIAVCFSGQPRHWRTAEKNIKQFFDFKGIRHPNTSQYIQVDYFMHTWNINTWRKPRTHHHEFEEVEHNDNADLVAAFNPVAHEIEKFNRDKLPRAWDPMFYSFARSLILKREHELNNQFEYDMVVKARLDTVYPNVMKFPLSKLWPGVCYTVTPISKFPSEFNYNNFDDVMFYGDSKTMDLVGDIYDTYKILHNPDALAKNESSVNTDPTMWYGPGCMLYEHLTNLSIHPDGSRGFEYAVVRSTAVDAGLDGLDDYMEIRKKYFEWYI